MLAAAAFPPGILIRGVSCSSDNFRQAALSYERLLIIMEGDSLPQSIRLFG
ncbi:hypothetical protein [Paenibacillus hamazuiensis]|uniref:hypothetical protein n=1 Tax=Paenibacillus hamazuiensis TaxID=2936508 RepID=UPI00200F7A86|nr:hypothetical protein [Paenibacillus hamazuiensis]